MTKMLHFRNTGFTYFITTFFVLMSAMLAPSRTEAYPLVRNYNRYAYNAGTQNWEISQDSFGRMLFANNTGLLIYDSRNWSLLQLSNYTTVRSI